jgi:hypothetical protein
MLKKHHTLEIENTRSVDFFLLGILELVEIVRYVRVMEVEKRDAIPGANFR